VCGTARWRAAGSVGAAVDGLRRPADGLLSPEQTADGRVPQTNSGNSGDTILIYFPPSPPPLAQVSVFSTSAQSTAQAA
jgi:hypothetical protein